MRTDNSFEGANPSSPHDIESLGSDRFLVRPWSEDGDGNYKFCLNFQLINDTNAQRPVTLLVDWDDLEYMGDRDYVLLGRDEEWHSVPGRIEGSVTTAHLEVAPGAWSVGLHPLYDFARLSSDRRQALAAGLTERVIGQSHDGREIIALETGPNGAPAILLVARFHPYETAGSFCLSGVLQMLATDLAQHGPLTSRYRFVIVPMPNPDGVARGCCKRARQGGPDLCHEGADSGDPAGQALIRLLTETAPRAYLDLHGWMHRNHDGLVYTNEAMRDTLAAALTGDPIFGKAWRGSDWSLRPPERGDFCMRAHADHGAVSFIVSPSWFGRTVPQMRAYGQKLVRALCGLI